MGNIFAGSEIVEMGIQIEKNGRDFYNAVFKKTKIPKAKEIFAYLAQEEERHIKVFEGILAKLEKYEPPESYPGEYFAYMNALASEYVFTQKDKGEALAKEAKSELEAVDIGIKAEKDSIIFYEGMKKIVPSFDQKVIEELIIQEQNHLRQLSDLKKTF